MTPETRAPRDRENDDPAEGVRPLPRVLITLALAGGVWGAWYLGTSQSQVSPMLGDQRTTAAFAAAPASARVDGAQVFTGKCSACHQATGLGLPGVFPPLAKSPYVLGPDRRLVQILLHGIVGHIDVLGNDYNGAMPAWNALSDAELAAVATYVRSAFGNMSGPISADFVAKERAATASRTTPWGGGEELESLR
jgi:mono/diheme cytochrome c family protein